ncbi:transcriptional regulator, TetR family [Rhodovulum sulfidophilum]|uniref:Transcriptional regulator, TetR family n=1 Tax=Rhodovulum sulfidophilum TaxID=35806 RepID=A0A0D6B858_RHOSU|nr:transcriptional regulator, TetR family [Rhodovulum sulfidophilum]
MTAKTVRIRKERKFDQRLEEAREAFLRDSFKPASVAPHPAPGRGLESHALHRLPRQATAVRRGDAA